MEVAYSSPIPLRIRARPDGQPDGQMTSGSILHPAGAGTALAWFGYREPAKSGKVTVTAHDDQGNLVASTSFGVDLGWSGNGAKRPVPGWVSVLSEKQVRFDAAQQPTEDTGPLDLIVSFMFVAVPGYFVLQTVALKKLKGGWRTAALAPLLVMVPAALHAVLALSAGSNLWPIVLILVSPLGFLYLLALFGMRFFARTG